MSIRAQCSGCSRKLLIPDNLAGKTIRCPQCSTQFVARPFSDQGITAQSAARAGRPGSGLAAPREAAAAPPQKRSLLRLLILACLFLGFLGVGVIVAGGAALYYFKGAWKEYSSKDGGFSVLLPGTPTESKKPDAKIEEGVEIWEVLAKAGADTAYSVHYYDLSDIPGNQYLFFTGLKSKFEAALPQAKVLEEQEVKLTDYTGREFSMEVGGAKTFVRQVFLVQNRVFFVTAQHPKAKAPPPDNQKFFKSFKITKAPEFKAKPKVEPTPAPAEGPLVKAPAKAPDKAEINPAEKPQPAFKMSNEEQELLKLINDFRGKEKAEKLVPRQDMFEYSRLVANATAKGQQPPALDRAKFNYPTISANNYAVDSDAQGLFKFLMKSKQIRASLVEAYEFIGIGVAPGADGRNHYFIFMAGNKNIDDVP